MTNKITESPILTDYHINRLKEHKKFLAILLTQERNQERLRTLYENTPKIEKKKRVKLKKKIIPRPRGRPRKCFTYDVAREIIRGEGIGSLSQYERWWQMNRPYRMPKNPERAYKAIWTGWGDFLGVYNKWSRQDGDNSNGKGKYRSFEDARRFARSLDLHTMMDWHAYTKTGKCPIDIPHRPDVVYGKGDRTEYWLSWKDFLDYSIKSTSDKIADVSPVIYIGRNPYTTNKNVYVINTIPGGRAALEHHTHIMQLTLICAYYIDGKFDKSGFMEVLPKYSKDGNVDEYMISNIYEVMEYLGDNLEKVI